jgi:lambda family phage portal protein
MLSAIKEEIVPHVINAIAAAAHRPLLYDANNRPLPLASQYVYRRDAAKRTGSMANWTPRKLWGPSAEAMDREAVVERSIDLVNNDPHAAGIMDNIASYVVGAGLTPYPTLDRRILELDREQIRQIQAQEKAVYWAWNPWADAGRRMTAGQIQYQIKCNLIRYGENFTLFHMIPDPIKPFSLALQIVNPQRVRTPTDKQRSNIRDGVELGEYGEPVAYWVKRYDPNKPYQSLSDTSGNFLRIPARAGHRWVMSHTFVTKEPDQVRGWPFFTAAMKYFRDFNDLLNAELVSNVVTAALAYAVELGAGDDPYQSALRFGTREDTSYTDPGGTERQRRIQEVNPGSVHYLNNGEKMTLLAATRPGTTFDPFTKTVKKSLAMSINLPYPVTFKDVEGVNFAGFRSAMLDAWRVFSMYRTWLGEGDCQRSFTMLQEEAWLRGLLSAIRDIHENLFEYTYAAWRGSPKGDIEPVKAVQANILKIDNNLMTRDEAIIEDGGEGFESVAERLQEEQEDLRAKGLYRESKDLDSGSGPGMTGSGDDDENNPDETDEK